MMKAQLEVTLGGNQWILDHRKAAYIPGFKMLILSDVHLGKVQHFRKNGIAVPAQAAAQNHVLMTALLADYEVESILFLGDLFHSADNTEHRLLEQLHLAFPSIQMLLVPGNHDLAMLRQLPPYLQLTNTFHRLGNILFSHHPPEISHSDHFHCYGHLHPAVEVRGKARQRLKFPAFMYTAAALIMPAFGHFTGSIAANTHLKEAQQVLCTPEGLWPLENHKFS